MGVFTFGLAVKRLDVLLAHAPKQDHAGSDKAFFASTERGLAAEYDIAETAGPVDLYWSDLVLLTCGPSW